MELTEIDKLKRNPRMNFIRAVREKDTVSCLVKAAEIHSHFCPGTAPGVMASVYGLWQLGVESMYFDGIMEDLVAMVEVNACFADGVQAVSECTLGNNVIVYRDFGRLAVTFARRGKETAPIKPSFVCPECGEEIMGTKIVQEGASQELCFTCGHHPYFEVEGQGIVKIDNN